MLTFAEEIYLLSLDDVTGKIMLSSREIVLDPVLVGAVLAELSLLRKIDNDTENIYVLNTELTGDNLLDFVLEKFAGVGSDTFTIDHVIRVVLHDAGKLENMVLQRLLDKGILKKVEDKILWIFPSRRYPVINDHEIKDVETRLREVVMSDKIPAPREAILISLVEACGLFNEILSPREYQRCQSRITEIAKIDLINRKIKQLIAQIQEISAITPYV